MTQYFVLCLSLKRLITPGDRIISYFTQTGHMTKWVWQTDNWIICSLFSLFFDRQQSWKNTEVFTSQNYFLISYFLSFDMLIRHLWCLILLFGQQKRYDLNFCYIILLLKYFLFLCKQIVSGLEEVKVCIERDKIHTESFSEPLNHSEVINLCNI